VGLRREDGGAVQREVDRLYPAAARRQPGEVERRDRGLYLDDAVAADLVLAGGGGAVVVGDVGVVALLAGVEDAVPAHLELTGGRAAIARDGVAVVAGLPRGLGGGDRLDRGGDDLTGAAGVGVPVRRVVVVVLIEEDDLFDRGPEVDVFEDPGVARV